MERKEEKTKMNEDRGRKNRPGEPSSAPVCSSSPDHLRFKSVVFLIQLLDTFEMRLLLRMQTLVLFWIRIFLLTHQMLEGHKDN